MTVADVIEDAKYGELSQLGVVKNLKSSDPAVVVDAEKQIISYINLALIELFKRFSLRTEETSIVMTANETLYPLTPTNLNKVYALYDENGEEYPLNDEENPNSINTPSYNVLQILNPSEGGGVFVLYNAAPDRIDWAADLSLITVPIPPVLLEALLHYVGYRGHGATDGSIQAENNTHYMRFDASCKRIVDLGLLADDAITSGTKLEDKGFI